MRRPPGQSSLLLAVLAEIKTLLANYAAANGKYEEFLPQGDVDWDDHKEPETELIYLLCSLPADKEHGAMEQCAKKKNHLKKVRKFGKSIIQTGRNLRTIIVEPKRLVWAAVDKESIEGLISKLEDLNSFLITLLDSSQIRRLQDTMSTTYLEILQIRNDVEGLTSLVKALAPTGKHQQSFGASTTGPESNPLSQAVAQETEAQKKKKKEYLKKLVEIKIQFTTMNQLSSQASISSDAIKFIGTLLEPEKLTFAEGILDKDDIRQRTNATYQGISVWIEWKDIPARESLSPSREQVENRIRLLTDLLCFEKPEGFRAPPCLGYVKPLDHNNEPRLGIVFKKPPNVSAESELVTLRELLEQRPKPSLSARISLCAVLARCIHSFHTVNWLYKGLRSSNIIFFPSSSEHPDLSSPYVSGFELSRPSIIDNMTEKPKFDPSQDIYRHPDAQSSRTDGNYRKSYDIYSLGVVVIEIAFWKSIEDIVGFEDLAKVRPSALRELQPWLLGRPFKPNVALPQIPANRGPCLQRVAPECSDAFHNIVECCLTADYVEPPEYRGEPESSIALRLQRVMEEDIVKKLDRIADALQKYT